MKLSNLATAAVFAAFLAAPIGSLSLFGPHKMAEKTVTTAELISSKIVTPDDKYRNDVSRRLVINSPVGMDAISAKNRLDFRVFGFVNTPQVISGEDGWLFFKPGFQNGKCLSDRDIQVALSRIEAMRALAEAVGIDFRVSVSPDKEVVYPERLGPAAEAAAGCKINSSRRWRELAAASGSSLIDHLKVLGHSYTDDLLYLKTDTHWNDLGRILSISQIANVYLAKELKIPSISTGEKFRDTDMTRKILRIYYKENFKVYGDFFTEELGNISEDRLSSALILHDSFYASAKSLLEGIFVDPKYLAFRAADFDAQVKAAFAKRPAHVLVNTVERLLFSRVLGGEISWGRGVGAALLDANANAARECAVSDAAKDSLTLKNMNELQAGDFAAGVDPQIFLKLSDRGRPCIRVSFDTTVKQRTFIYLPVRDPMNRNGPNSEGFSLMLTDAPGPREFWLVLPEDFAGTTLRIDPIVANGPVSKLKIHSGFLPSTEIASVR